MIKKILILLKLARKLALSDALKIVSKIHEPPLIIKIFLGIFSISLFGKTKQNLNLSDEERLCNSVQDMGTTFIKLGQFLSTRPDIIGEKLSKVECIVEPRGLGIFPLRLILEIDPRWS